jgi:threonine aldolase
MTDSDVMNSIDLRSDTVTQPSSAMRDVMRDAPVGDDVYVEDPTIIALESYAANLLGKEAAIFAPSGTQSNLLGLLAHCQRGDEYIVGSNAHTFRYEGGGAAVLGSIQPHSIPMDQQGCMSLEDIRGAVKPDDIHFACSKVVCLENTHAGTPLPAGYVPQVRQLCDEFSLALHLDGARLFNAAVAQNVSPAVIAEHFDSVSICLSKGLGAPVGSLLVGRADLIKSARRWRKVLGGGMRQGGIIAAGGLHALTYHVHHLVLDHQRADRVARVLQSKFGAGAVRLATNMIHLNLPPANYEKLALWLGDSGIKVGRPRWVFHRDIDDNAEAKLCDRISGFNAS